MWVKKLVNFLTKALFPVLIFHPFSINLAHVWFSINVMHICNIAYKTNCVSRHAACSVPFSHISSATSPYLHDDITSHMMTPVWVHCYDDISHTELNIVSILSNLTLAWLYKPSWFSPLANLETNSHFEIISHFQSAGNLLPLYQQPTMITWSV